MKKVIARYRPETVRLKGYDYGSHGYYFITICTKKRVPYFGYHMLMNQNRPDNTAIDLSQSLCLYSIAQEYWMEIPKHFAFVVIDAFVIMPDHMHGILFFNRPDKQDWIPNRFGPQSYNLASVIRGYKGSLKRYANKNNIDFEWQAGFYEHIIRDEPALERIRNYITMNPFR
jgi:REP element-mobilizing transposase RayT